MEKREIIIEAALDAVSKRRNKRRRMSAFVSPAFKSASIIYEIYKGFIIF